MSVERAYSSLIPSQKAHQKSMCSCLGMLVCIPSRFEQPKSRPPFFRELIRCESLFLSETFGLMLARVSFCLAVVAALPQVLRKASQSCLLISLFFCRQLHVRHNLRARLRKHLYDLWMVVGPLPTQAYCKCGSGMAPLARFAA